MRCYNGQPDSKLQALLNYEKNLKNKLNRIIPDARCVYFPNGEFYIVFVNNIGLWYTESKSLEQSILLAIKGKLLD